MNKFLSTIIYNLLSNMKITASTSMISIILTTKKIDILFFSMSNIYIPINAIYTVILNRVYIIQTYMFNLV